MGAERLASFGELCAAYEGVTHEDRYRNYQQFLDAIIPTCEEFDVKMGADAGGPMAWRADFSGPSRQCAVGSPSV